MQLAFDCALESTFHLNVTSLNFIRLTSVRIDAGITPGSVAFGIGAAIQISTYSSLADSNCDDPAAEAACLTADITAAIEVSPYPIALLSLTMSLSVQGVWVEPFGLYNFAVANPSFSLGLDIYASGVPAAPYCPLVPPAPCPIPRLVAWSLTIYWKRSVNWPPGLQVKMANPDLGGADLLALSSHFVFEKAPHADPLLGTLPRFAIKVTITTMTLTDVIGMAYDLGRSLAEAATGRQLDPLPSFISGIDDFLALEFSLP